MSWTTGSEENTAGVIRRGPADSQDALPADRLPERMQESTTLTPDRRTFLKAATLPCLAACGGLGGSLVVPLEAARSGDDSRFVREARHYKKLAHKKVQCQLCPRGCVVDDRERGYCGDRENRGGTYYTLVYSRICSAHIDPIEKKPFFHVYPGTMAFSIATAGCNVNCKFCQNWEISQVRPEQVRSIYVPPRKVAALARANGCVSIAYTYSEPVVFDEYMVDTAKAGHREGVKSVVVTGGYIQQDPLKELCGVVEAIKVDLKAFSEKYYKEVVNGELKPVLDAIVTMRKLGMWTEIVYLVVPGLNDSDAELKGLVRWVKTELGPDVPLHFSRFFPQYLLKNLPPTPMKTMERAKAIADSEGLHYVYLGNVPGNPAESTYCPRCGRKIVDRVGYIVRAIHIRKGRCQYCGEKIPGLWKP